MSVFGITQAKLGNSSQSEVVTVTGTHSIQRRYDTIRNKLLGVLYEVTKQVVYVESNKEARSRNH